MAKQKAYKYTLLVETVLTSEQPLAPKVLKAAARQLKDSQGELIVEDSGLPPEVFAKTKSVVFSAFA